MKTENVEIDNQFGDQYKGTYVFSEITWSKRQSIVQKNTRYNVQTGKIVKVDEIKIQAELIYASLVSQPEGVNITLDLLLSEDPKNALPPQLQDIFAKVVTELCGLSKETTRFLLMRLSEPERTRLLLSLGYVKSSDGQSTSSDVSQPEK